MGYRVFLMAVKQKAPETVHAELGVTPTGEYEDIPESPLLGAVQPENQYLLYINNVSEVPDETMLARLSAGTLLLTCYVNETVMSCETCGWANGVRQWSVSHDAQQGLTHCETKGAVPEEFQAILGRCPKEQAADPEVDSMFEAPIELFVACGGVRYDEDLEGEDPTPWQVLQRK